MRAIILALALTSAGLYIFHLDPWKDSELFKQLLEVAGDKPRYPVPLSLDEPGMQAAIEAERLIRDDFKYAATGEFPGVVSCAAWSFPVKQPARFNRDGSVLRGDNYVYAVELYVDESCQLIRADGRAGPVPFL